MGRGEAGKAAAVPRRFARIRLGQAEPPASPGGGSCWLLFLSSFSFIFFPLSFIFLFFFPFSLSFRHPFCFLLIFFPVLLGTMET